MFEFKQIIEESVKEILDELGIEVRDFYIGIRKRHFLLVDDACEAFDKYLDYMECDIRNGGFLIDFYDNPDQFELVKAVEKDYVKKYKPLGVVRDERSS